MGLRKFLKRAVGVDDEQPGPVYRAPMDETMPDGRTVNEAVMGAAPSRQDARYPADTLAPVYNPPAQDPAPAVAAAQPDPVYAPAQTGTMADQYMAKAVPVDQLTRPRIADPSAIKPAGAQVTYVTKKGQQVPTGATGGADELENQQAYLRALEAYKPQNHNSRLASGGIDAGRAYMRGGGIVGAATGFVRGLVDPKSDEEYANEASIAKTGRAVSQEQLNRKEASDRANEATKRAQEEAATQKILYPIYEPKPTQADDGTYANITPGSDVAQPIYNPPGPDGTRTPFKGKTPAEKAGKPKIGEVVGPGGRKERWELDEDGKPAKQVAVQTPDGLWVSPNSKYVGDRQGEQQKWTRNRDTKLDNQRSEDRSQMSIDKAQARKEKAGALTAKVDSETAKWNFANKKMSELQGQMTREPDPTKRETLKSGPGGLDYWENERAKAHDNVTGAAQELNNSYGDIYEAGPGTDIGYYKIRPWSEKAARSKFPHATPAQIQAAKEMAAAQGQPIVP